MAVLSKIQKFVPLFLFIVESRLFTSYRFSVICFESEKVGRILRTTNRLNTFVCQETLPAFKAFVAITSVSSKGNMKVENGQHLGPGLNAKGKVKFKINNKNRQLLPAGHLLSCVSITFFRIFFRSLQPYGTIYDKKLEQKDCIDDITSTGSEYCST